MDLSDVMRLKMIEREMDLHGTKFLNFTDLDYTIASASPNLLRIKAHRLYGSSVYTGLTNPN
jgi:hypothetical protein